MFGKESVERSFKGGDWDLRKDERRQVQKVISFPDRRKDERRLTKMHDHYATRLGIDSLNWVGKTGLDE